MNGGKGDGVLARSKEVTEVDGETRDISFGIVGGDGDDALEHSVDDRIILFFRNVSLVQDVSHIGDIPIETLH